MTIFASNLLKTARFTLRSLTPNIVTKCQYSVQATGNEVVVERLEGHQTGITVLGLNRPEAKNAFSLGLVETFSDILSDRSL